MSRLDAPESYTPPPAGFSPRATTYAYNLDGQVTSITRPDGVSIVPTYEASGRLDFVTTIERDQQGRPEAIVAPFGQRTELTLDSNGYLESVESPASERYEMEYTPLGLMTRFENPRGQASTFTWDPLGRLERDEDALGGYSQLSRSETASSYSVTKSSALGRTTTYTTESLPTGETRTSVTSPAGTVSVSTKSPSGQTTSTSPDGTVAVMREGPDPRFGMQTPLATSMTVTTPGGLISSTSSSRAVTFVDPAGDPKDPANVASVADQVTVNGRTISSTYDVASRTMTTTSPLGRQGATTFDLYGRVTGTSSPGVLSATYSYDANGRLTDVDQGSRNTHTTYDTDGYVQSVRDALDRTTSFTYDDAGRVRTQTLPDSRVLNFNYDANGNLTSITPPGRPQHLFGHDIVDRTTSYDPPDVGLPLDQTTFAYNLDHQVELVTRPDGQTIDPVYGSTTGRLESVATPRGIYVYSYGPTSGNLVSVSDPDGGSLAFAYDGSLPTSVTWSGAVAGSVAFAYNASFEPTSRTLNGGAALGLDYNLDGQLTNAGAMTLSYAETTGFFTGSTLLDTTDALTYTTYSELDTYAGRKGGGTLYSFDLGRDAGGRITQKSETIEGTTSLWEYRYDTAGRLDEVKKDGAVVATYGYDSNSNRVSWTDFWGSGSATYDVQDRLLTSGPRSYTYTANGELLTKTNGTDVTTYGYDVFGNLRTVELPTGVEIEYLIDAANRRIGKRVNDTLVSGFLWQSQLQPAAELDGSGAIISEFVYGTKGNVPDYVVKGETTYRIFTDHLGSVRLVVDADLGTVAQRLDYDAFGRVILDTNPGFQPFGFAGGLYDPQTGLTRFGARDYDAEIGRWTSKDPIGFAGGDTNLYGYVVNDPVNLFDPHGEDWLDSVGNFAAGFGDSLTFGLTGQIRRWMGVDHVVNKCSGAFSAGEWTGIGVSAAMGGRGLPAGLRRLSRGAKGAIGESLSIAENTLRGSRLVGTQVSGRSLGLTTRFDSVWRSASGQLYFVESKFGTAGLTSAQRTAAKALGAAYHVERWGYPFFGRVGTYAGLGYGVSGAMSDVAACGCN